MATTWLEAYQKVKEVLLKGAGSFTVTSISLPDDTQQAFATFDALKDQEYFFRQKAIEEAEGLGDLESAYQPICTFNPCRTI